MKPDEQGSEVQLAPMCPLHLISIATALTVLQPTQVRNLIATVPI